MNTPRPTTAGATAAVAMAAALVLRDAADCRTLQQAGRIYLDGVTVDR